MSSCKLWFEFGCLVIADGEPAVRAEVMASYQVSLDLLRSLEEQRRRGQSAVVALPAHRGLHTFETPVDCSQIFPFDFPSWRTC